MGLKTTWVTKAPEPFMLCRITNGAAHAPLQCA